MSLSNEYIERIRQLRRAKRLHGYVEEQLVSIMRELAPEFHPIKEPQGLAGGRNDLLLFDFTGRKVLFEIFATKNQVSRDLRLLDKTNADIKIAVVIDEEVDPGVLQQFLRENPEENYPFLFIHDITESSHNGKLKLWQLVKGDEETRFQTMLASRIRAKGFIEQFRDIGADVFTQDDLETHQLSFKKILITWTLKKLSDGGFNDSALKPFAIWFSNDDIHKYLVMQLIHGCNMYLYTDLKGTFDVLSDYELLEWLMVGHEFSEPYILLSMNATVAEVIENYLNETEWVSLLRPVQFTIGLARMIEEADGRIMFYSLPKRTKRIYMIPPMPEDDDQPKLRKSYDDYLKMIEFPRNP